MNPYSSSRSFLEMYIHKAQDLAEGLPQATHPLHPNLAAIAAPIFNRLAAASCIPVGIINAVVIDPTRRAMDPSYRRNSRAWDEFSDSLRTVFNGALGIVTGDLPQSTSLKDACFRGDLEKVEALLKDCPLEEDSDSWNIDVSGAYPKTYECLAIALNGRGSSILENEKKKRTKIALKLLKPSEGSRSPLFFSRTLFESDFLHKAIELDYKEVIAAIENRYLHIFGTLADIALTHYAPKAFKLLLDKGYRFSSMGHDYALQRDLFTTLKEYYQHPLHQKGDFGIALNAYLVRLLQNNFCYNFDSFRSFLLSVQEICSIDPPTETQEFGRVIRYIAPPKEIKDLKAILNSLFWKLCRNEKECAYLLLDFFAEILPMDYHQWIQESLNSSLSNTCIKPKIQNAGKIARTKVIQRFEIIIEAEMKARPKDYTGYDIQGACIPHFRAVYDYLVPSPAQ